MLRYAMTAVILLCLVLLMQACSKQGSEPQTPQAAQPNEQGASEPAFAPRTIAIPDSAKFSDTQSSFLAPKYLVITDAEEFEKLWQEIYRDQFPHPTLEEIDFSKDMVIAVFMGQCPTSGYSIDIIEATEYADRLEIQIIKHPPAPGSGFLQVITRPFCMAKIEKIDKPARFIEVSTGSQP